MRRRDRVTSTERLRDHALRPFFEHQLLSARDLDRLHLPAQSEFSVFVHDSILLDHYLQLLFLSGKLIE